MIVSSLAMSVSRACGSLAMNLSREMRSLQAALITFASSYTLTLQRHLGVLSKFAHVESRLCGRQRRGKAAFDVSINPCARRACSRSVAVGLTLKISRLLSESPEGAHGAPPRG